MQPVIVVVSNLSTWEAEDTGDLTMNLCLA